MEEKYLTSPAKNWANMSLRASPTVAVTGAVSKKVTSLARGRRKLMLQQMLQPVL
jgi:hypothetical protein